MFHVVAGDGVAGVEDVAGVGDDKLVVDVVVGGEDDDGVGGGQLGGVQRGDAPHVGVEFVRADVAVVGNDVKRRARAARG